MDYSVVIRTVGTAGKKYQCLLECIKKQTIQPSEVVVVLPKDYALPKERIGNEIFVFSEKGMVAQRIFGGKVVKSEYVLFLDDDLSFSETFVQEMYEPIEKGIGDVSIPACLDMLPPKSGLKKIVPIFSLSACPTILHRKSMYTKVLKSGGWSYNNFDSRSVAKFLKAETAAGACFFSKLKDFQNIHFEDELWLQDVKYPLWEDQVMFYKFHLQGKRIVCITGVEFAHLDAGGQSQGRAQEAAYANSRNKFIFWYKFIYCEQSNVFGRLSASFLYNYGVSISLMIGMLNGLRSKDKKAEYSFFKQGLKSGRQYTSQIRSKQS